MPMTISIDDELKESFTEVCKEIGLTPSAAFGVFAKTVVREKRIPFSLSAVSHAERDAMRYEKAVADGIWAGYRDFTAGRTVTREESKKMRAALQ